VLETIANVNKNEDDSSFDITLKASDSDGDTISYEATSSDTSIATVSERSWLRQMLRVIPKASKSI